MQRIQAPRHALDGLYRSFGDILHYLGRRVNDCLPSSPFPPFHTASPILLPAMPLSPPPATAPTGPPPSTAPTAAPLPAPTRRPTARACAVPKTRRSPASALSCCAHSPRRRRFPPQLVGQRLAIRPIRVTTGANVTHGRGFVKVLCAGVPQHLLWLRPAWAVVHCAAATPTKGSKR